MKKIYILIFLFLFLPSLVSAGYYFPYDWNCKINGDQTIQCYQNQTTSISLVHIGGATYCSRGYRMCWEYNTGIMWYWESDFNGVEDSLIYEPKEEYGIYGHLDYYGMHYTYIGNDRSWTFEKVIPSIYEDYENYELKNKPGVSGVWQNMQNVAAKGCEKFNGVRGYYEEDEDSRYCLYWMYVDEYDGVKCDELYGVPGVPQEFVGGRKYCIYNLEWLEDLEKCSNEEGYASVKLPNIDFCMKEVVTDKTSLDDAFDEEIRCEKNGTYTDAFIYNDGKYDNATHIYYLCEPGTTIRGDFSQCWTNTANDSKYLNVSDVKNKFGKQMEGYTGYYCKTSALFEPPQNEMPEFEMPDISLTPDSLDCVGILGRPDDNISKPPAFYLQTAFTVMKYVAIVILIVFTIMDYTGAVASQDDDAIKKATSKLVTRLIICVILFVLPTLIEFLFKILDIYGDAAHCKIN